jgi:phage terminase small subunit
LAAEFGLTPASRTRIQTPAVTEEDEFAAFLGRRNGDGMRDE